MTKPPGKKQLVKDISANTLQTGITQVFGLLIFYLSSRYLSKDDFGEFNWSLAIGSTIIAIASLGLDLVFVKRIAAGANVIVMSGIHFFHTVIIGVGLCIVLFLWNYFQPVFVTEHPVFFYVFVHLAIANMANSFKLCLNGLEAYRKLAILALCVNTLKFAGIIYLYVFSGFTVYGLIAVYIVTSLLEFAIAYTMMNRSVAGTVKPVLRIMEYKYFILESLPQLGVVLFDSALARIDWILLRFISTPGLAVTAASITAEYSFTYKVFEIAKLPLLIISPVLLTRLSKIMSKGEDVSDKHKADIATYFRIELFLIMLIPVFLTSCWSPLIDFFTDNKYGAVNETTFWLLAPCVPLLAVINFLWTIGFAQGQLKEIMYITVFVSILNIALNFLFIPKFNALGAAAAYLGSTVAQLILYVLAIRKHQLSLQVSTLLILLAGAAGSVIIVKLLHLPLALAVLLSLIIYVATAFLTAQVKLKDLAIFRNQTSS